MMYSFYQSNETRGGICETKRSLVQKETHWKYPEEMDFLSRARSVRIWSPFFSAHWHYGWSIYDEILGRTP